MTDQDASNHIDDPQPTRTAPPAVTISHGVVVSLPDILFDSEEVGPIAFRLYVEAATVAEPDGFIPHDLGTMASVAHIGPQELSRAVAELLAAGLLVSQGDELARPRYYLMQLVETPIASLVEVVVRKLALHLDVTITDNVNRSVARFLERLPFAEVLNALEVAQQAAKQKGLIPDAAFRYFCGVCWNKINTRSKEGREQ